MDSFASKSVQTLQKYLKERGVIYSSARKQSLIELCETARSLNIEVDPDCLIEDRAEIITSKLRIDEQLPILTNPQLMASSDDVSILPIISIFDIYNYLVSFDEFNHSTLREYHKMEGYTLFKDGFVIGLESVQYDIQDYVAVKAKVRPRTKDKDPITKLKFYNCWVIMKKDQASIHSAFCSCKGGMDGCCRHVVATLFELLDFMQDKDKTSCTSKPCVWTPRASDIAKPVPAADLDTAVLTSSSFKLPRPIYHPLPDDVDKPDTRMFLQDLQQMYPKACVLRSMFNITQDNTINVPMTVPTPLEKLEHFLKEHTCIIDTCCCANIFVYYHLGYTSDQCAEIEEATRGQCKNDNWHRMRKGLLTASLFHQVCCSTDINRTAESLLKLGLNEECLPQAVMFGRMYEDKARNMFFKGHRFRHRKCSLSVPGLVMYEDSLCPILACSPDGIVDCKICGKFLIEVKCSFKYKCFHAKNALKLSKICHVGDDDKFIMNKSHKYYSQIQGQMAVSGIYKSVLVFYTHKGIVTVDVDYDEEFWLQCREKLLVFYRDAYFSALKRSVVA